MRLSMIQLLFANQEPMDAPARREHVSPPWRSGSPTWTLSGSTSYGGTTRTARTGERNRSLVSQQTATGRDPLDAHSRPGTDQQASAQATSEWFVLQWQMEVTFHEIR